VGKASLLLALVSACCLQFTSWHFSLITFTWSVLRCLVTIYGYRVVWFWTWFAESAPWTS